MMASAAAYIPPSFGQPGVSISYRPKPLLSSAAAASSSSSTPCPVVTVAVPPASIHHIFAHRQWRAGMLMSDALVSRAFDISGRSVLELGAGTGLPSIAAAHLHTAATVVASDYDEPALVRELKHNVAANMASAAPEVRRSIKVAGHIWGKNTEDLLDCLAPGAKFDCILLADCMWDPLSHADLLRTLVAVLARTPEARVNVIAGLHTGREKVTSFMRRAARAGLVLAPIEAPQAWPALPDDAHDQHDPDATRPGNESMALASERVLELQVCGNTPIQQDGAADGAAEAAGEDEPRLTGDRRLFRIEGYGEETEGDVKLRNRWLTRALLLRAPAVALSLASGARTRASVGAIRSVGLRAQLSGPTCSVRAFGTSQRRFNAQVGEAAEPRVLATYAGPLEGTFKRLKLFSLGSLALASVLTPVLLLAPGEISMAGRVGLCLTALATSGVSTALIAWIGTPYVGTARLVSTPQRAHVMELNTLDWRLRRQRTLVYEPAFLRPTSRPFAAWEITNAPPKQHTQQTKHIAETFDVKTGKSIGAWHVTYAAQPDGEVQAKVAVTGKPTRYFNVHEELLGEDWQVLG